MYVSSKQADHPLNLHAISNFLSWLIYPLNVSRLISDYAVTVELVMHRNRLPALARPSNVSALLSRKIMRKTSTLLVRWRMTRQKSHKGRTSFDPISRVLCDDDASVHVGRMNQMRDMTIISSLDSVRTQEVTGQDVTRGKEKLLSTPDPESVRHKV